jgi:hypothetical protein
MDTTMELDDLKLAWQTLDRRLQEQNALGRQLLAGNRLDRARAQLRPLYLGQILQIVGGAALALLAAPFWIGHRDVPHLLIAGLTVHAYAIAMIVVAARTLYLLRCVDYSAPVLAIQKQLATLRDVHVRNGLIVGLAWWWLWIPLLMMALMGAFGADLYARAPSVVVIGGAISMVGLAATWWLLRWARDPRRPRLARFVEDGVTGTSLRRAQTSLADIVAFEHET